MRHRARHNRRRPTDAAERVNLPAALESDQSLTFSTSSLYQQRKTSNIFPESGDLLLKCTGSAGSRPGASGSGILAPK